MQLEFRPDDLVDVTDHDQRHALEPAMNGDQMHAVEREIDKTRQPSLDRHAAADQIAHQRSYRGEMAQRNQRAMIVIDEVPKRPPLYQGLEIVKAGRRHL